MQNVWHIPRTTSHMLSSCSALAPTKYLARHNSVLKNLLFELLRKLGLIDTTPLVSTSFPGSLGREDERPWERGFPSVFGFRTNWNQCTKTSALKLIGMCHSLCWEHSSQSKENLDARIINLHKEDKTIALLEMSCPWIENREAKESEKTRKYAPLYFELKRPYPGYEENQQNIIAALLKCFHKHGQKPWGTQRLFSIKYLFGEANIA